ncbi:helix-turn-helix domain-containing protein [Enterococcus sp. DIV0800]|uniref:helix-turn-helix domain-containing protein n=1 Tax=unclassified Enterococcus TaxID=2608891 RepID=UPI003D2FFBCD
MHIRAVEIQSYDKNIYYSLCLLELMADGKAYKQADLADLLAVDVRSVQRFFEDLSKSYNRFTETKLPLFKKIGPRYQLMIADQALEQEQFAIDLIRRSLAFRLLELVIAGQGKTVKDLSKKLYRSESTIRRKLKELAGKLEPLQLAVERGRVVFKAPESVVRMYLSVYYWRLFRGKIWPFAPLNYQMIQKISRGIQDFFQVALNPLKAQRLEYLVGAHLLREAQHYAVEDPLASQAVLAADPLFKEFHTQLRPVMPAYFQTLAAMGNLFLNLLTREEYYHVPAITNKIHQLLAQKPFLVMQEVETINQRLKKKIADPTVWEKFIDLQAEDYLISGHLYHRLFPMIHFNINGKAFWTNITQQQPQLVTFVSEVLAEHGSESILFDRYLSVLRRLTELINRPTLRIFLQTDLPEFEETILKEDLRRFLANEYQVLFVEGKSEGDLCLTTSILSEVAQDLPTLLITQELRMSDYLALLQLLQGFGGKSF